MLKSLDNLFFFFPYEVLEQLEHSAITIPFITWM